MTKHESHIALLLLALISAGVFGYQVVNGDNGEKICYRTAMFSQTESSNLWHDNPIEILLPVSYDSKSGYTHSTLRDKSRLQDIINNDDQQPESNDDESDLNANETAEDSRMP